MDPIEVKAFQPKLSVEDHITLKLNQVFDPMSYVKAITYQNEDITAHVTVKSSNVDVTKKGDYEVVYEVTDQGATETRTTQVTVVSDYTYASDMNAQSAQVGWNSLKKDQSPSGGKITLVIEGLATGYDKV